MTIAELGREHIEVIKATLHSGFTAFLARRRQSVDRVAAYVVQFLDMARHVLMYRRGETNRGLYFSGAVIDAISAVFLSREED